jgi:hypothetical protein
MAARGGLTTRQIRAKLDEDATTQPKSIKIEGDAVIVVGEPKEFKASDDDRPVVATWTVDPPDGATLEAGGSTTEPQGTSVKLTASKKGTLKLTASAEAHIPATIPLAAIVAPAQTPRLPFVGRGYGTIMIALSILSVAGALSVLGKLNSAVATLLGALAGYIFLKDAPAAGGGGSTGGGESAAPGSGAQSGNTTGGVRFLKV